MFIYILKNTVNGKCYIGQTTHPDPTLRFKQHKNAAYGEGLGYKRTAIHRAIKKYGWDAFDALVIKECFSQQELDAAEISMIELHNSMSPNGYNLRTGGGRGKHTEETKEKLRMAHTGKKMSAAARELIRQNGLKRRHTAETRAIHSAKMKGRKPCDRTIERAKIANSGAGNGNAKLTWEIVRNIREIHSGGNTSCEAIANKFGVDRRSVERIIKNQRWMVENDPINTSAANLSP